MALDIGIDAKTRKKVVGALEVVLADTYSQYAKTHGYHWNIEGQGRVPLSGVRAGTRLGPRRQAGPVMLQARPAG